MTRLAYVSHVDSQWVKQRPQFLAEALGSHGGFDTTYVCSFLTRRRSSVRSQVLAVPVVRIPLLPQRLRRVLAIDISAGAFCGALLMLLARPRVVVVTHVRHYWMALTLSRIFGRKIYYDCMDRNEEFDGFLARDAFLERRLRRLASCVFCSSQAIFDDVSVEGGRARLVNNALSPTAVAKTRGSSDVRRGAVVYVGTVSSWFDFDAVRHLVESDDDAVVELYGPADVVIPKHDRIRHMGVVGHEKAMLVMRTADVLVLPFRLNRLILGVDPVKVYEYVASGRPAVCVAYPELDHFGARISRYSGSDDFVRVVTANRGRPSLDGKALEDFIETNSWAARAALVAEVINGDYCGSSRVSK